MKESSFAPAFESFYNNSSHTKSLPQSLYVSDFYDSYGWKSKFKGKIKDDHLAIELLFLTRLIEKYLELEDDACQREMSNEIRRFINLHLFSWISEWNKRVQLHSNTLCFKSIGTLILACVEDIYSLFDKDFSTIFSLENLKN